MTLLGLVGFNSRINQPNELIKDSLRVKAIVCKLEPIWGRRGAYLLNNIPSILLFALIRTTLQSSLDFGLNFLSKLRDKLDVHIRLQ